jgi:hypothetical protein
MRPNFAIDQSTVDFPAHHAGADRPNAVSGGNNAAKPLLPAGFIAG